MIFQEDQANSGVPDRPQINVVLNWFEELKERVPVLEVTLPQSVQPP